MATFEEQLHGGTRFPNRSLDFTMEVSGDLSAYENRVVSIDTGPTLTLVATSTFAGIAGILQNAPVDDIAVVRYGGVSKAVYGATIAVDELLVIEAATGRVLPLADGTQGHVHLPSIRILRRIVYLTNDLALPITGASSGDFTVTMKWDDAGSFNPASETVTVTEISGGYYWISFTPTEYGSAYFLWVEYASGGSKGVVTPSEFQVVPFIDLLGPTAISTKTIIGQALVAGVADDVGLIIVRPQMY